MIGNLIKRKEILSQASKVLPISTHFDYEQSIELLCHSTEILQLEDDTKLSSMAGKLHKAIDSYLSKLNQGIELEAMCELYEQSHSLKAA